MKHLNLLIILAAFSILFSSCNKDDDAQPATKTDFLVDKNWVPTAITINPAIQLNDSSVTNDWYGRVLPACVQDDIKIFSRNGSYRGEEGDDKCNSGDPQIFELGDWAFSDDETKLVVSANGNFSSYDIQELTATSLIYRYTVRSQGGGTTYTFIETYEVQP